MSERCTDITDRASTRTFHHAVNLSNQLSTSISIDRSQNPELIGDLNSNLTSLELFSTSYPPFQLRPFHTKPLQTLKRVKKLILRNLAIEKGTLVAIKKALPVLEELVLEFETIAFETIAKDELGRIDGLKRLELISKVELDDSVFVGCARQSRLVELSIKAPINQDSYVYFSRMHRLEKLSLNFSNSERDVWSHQPLKVNALNLPPSFFKALKKMNGLKELRIVEFPMTESFIRLLSQSAPSTLRTLYLGVPKTRFAQHHTPTNLENLINLPIVHLGLNKVYVPAEQMSALLSQNRIRRLSLSKCLLGESIPSLVANEKKLEKLELSDVTVTSKGGIEDLKKAYGPKLVEESLQYQSSIAEN